LKILYLVNYFPPSSGAAALNSKKIVDILIEYGHKIKILAPGDMGKTLVLKGRKRKEIPNIQINYSNKLIKSPLSWILSHNENMIKFLIKSRDKFNPDLIMSQYHPFHYASVCSSYIAKKLKIPHIVRSHDIFIDLESHSFLYNLHISLNYPQIFRSIIKSDIFYVTTSEMRKYFLKIKKLKDVNFKIHHNGIDVLEFFPDKNQEILKQKFGCETIISFIGLMTEDIGVHNFIKYLPDVFKIYKDAHLILIGDGPYKKQILSYIYKLGLSKKVHFLGIKPHDDIPFYINNSDIGIGRITHKKMWRYMIPVKCLEYMACGKPFLSTPISQDVLKNNDVGFLLKRDYSKDDLINKMSILIDDENLRKKLGENGLKKIHNEYKWECLMEDFNNNITELVKG